MRSICIAQLHGPYFEITESDDKGHVVNWGEHVTDDEYAKGLDHDAPF